MYVPKYKIDVYISAIYYLCSIYQMYNDLEFFVDELWIQITYTFYQIPKIYKRYPKNWSYKIFFVMDPINISETLLLLFLFSSIYFF